MTVTIVGEVSRFIFENKENNYRIFTVKDKENIYTLSGYIVSLEEGFMYEFICEEVHHPKYGTQYKVLSYQNIIDNSKEGIINYLSSVYSKNNFLSKAPLF